VLAALVGLGLASALIMRPPADKPTAVVESQR
jgi:hypothetical protein